MAWKLSRYRTGDLVEVRSREEILATLDNCASLDGMPFMPEMLQYCGQRFRVGAVAHKTCDTARQTWKLRRLQATVHLNGLRCDGSAHGGCQAECNIFWKDRWLKLAVDEKDCSFKEASVKIKPAVECTEARLVANTRLHPTLGEEPRYSCQATEMYGATRPLARWDVREYLYDVVTRNHSAVRVIRVHFLAVLRRLVSRTPVGYRVARALSDGMHRWLIGRPSPSLCGKIPPGSPTPTGRLDLNAGELVRIKAQQDIEQTLDERGKNRGLSFDPEEMAPYCGRLVTVRKRVTRIIEESSGKMLQMKQPCIMLDGVVCRGEFAGGRLNCPRAIPSYWRELWLERVRAEQQTSR